MFAYEDLQGHASASRSRNCLSFLCFPCRLDPQHVRNKTKIIDAQLGYRGRKSHLQKNVTLTYEVTQQLANKVTQLVVYTVHFRCIAGIR